MARRAINPSMRYAQGFGPAINGGGEGAEPSSSTQQLSHNEIYQNSTATLPLFPQSSFFDSFRPQIEVVALLGHPRDKNSSYPPKSFPNYDLAEDTFIILSFLSTHSNNEICVLLSRISCAPGLSFAYFRKPSDPLHAVIPTQ